MDEIDSPCIDICTIDRDSGECIGCGCTVEEVRNWTNFREFKCNKNSMYKIKIV